MSSGAYFDMFDLASWMLAHEQDEVKVQISVEALLHVLREGALEAVEAEDEETKEFVSDIMQAFIATMLYTEVEYLSPEEAAERDAEEKKTDEDKIAEFKAALGIEDDSAGDEDEG